MKKRRCMGPTVTIRESEAAFGSGKSKVARVRSGLERLMVT